MKLILILSFLTALSSQFRLQGVAVKGRLRCGHNVLRNTKVKLYDIDTNPGDPDDLLDEKYTDKEGEFQLDGTTRELTDIDPVLYIYHDCLDDIRPCQKMVTVTIPKHYIHSGKAQKWFDLGDLNLETIFPGQDRSCNLLPLNKNFLSSNSFWFLFHIYHNTRSAVHPLCTNYPVMTVKHEYFSGLIHQVIINI